MTAGLAGDDFIVTVHAIERMRQRFPHLVKVLTDQELGIFIHGEVMDAIEAGREGKVVPAELAPISPDRWVSQPPGGLVVWVEDKSRGYTIRCNDEGMHVITVLTGSAENLNRRRRLWR